MRFWLGPEADDEARDLLWMMQKHAFEVQVAAGEVDNEEWEVGGITAPVKLFTGAHEPAYFPPARSTWSRSSPTPSTPCSPGPATSRPWSAPPR